jgi:histidinol-phosphate/aromatic aminotransferase/cobyric acid decarboxylase-like protein
MNQFCPTSSRLKHPRTAAPFRLDHLLKERQDLFRWPKTFEADIHAITAHIGEAASAGVLAGLETDLQEKAERAARTALELSDGVSAVFGHSIIQLLEQVLITRSENHPVATLNRDFFLFDKTLMKLGIAQEKFPTLDELIRKSPSHHTVLLSAPNNPTTQDLSPCELADLVSAREGLVLLDEAYVLFSEDPEHRLAFLKKHPNLVLLRGTSKSGLAGLGLGYMLCSETTAVEFLQSRVSSMISAIQAAMAIRLFGKYDELRRMASRLAGMRDDTGRKIAQETRCHPVSGSCDFLLIRTGRSDCSEIVRTMNDSGIPALAYEPLPGYEDVVKLFPAAFERGDDIVRILSS